MAKWQSGSITPKKNKNGLAFQLRWRDSSGKQHKKTILGSKSEARLELNKILRQVDTGEFVGRNSLMYPDFVDTYIKAKKGNIAQMTLNSYESGLKEPRILKILGKKRLQSINSEDVLNVLNIWTKDNKLQYAKHVYQYLNGMFNFAVNMDLITKNPVDKVPKPKPQRTEKKAMTQQEWEIFYNSIEANDYYSKTYYRLMVVSGLRRSEMCGLRIGDINLNDRSLSVQRAYIVNKGHGLYTDTKNHQSQNVPIDDKTYDVIMSYLDNLNLIAMQYEVKLTPDTPLFVNPTSLRPNKEAKPINPDSWSKWFKKICKKAGLDRDFTIHELRHTTASILILELGYDALVVQKRLRHADAGFTLNTYTHLFAGAQRKASEDIGTFLKS